MAPTDPETKPVGVLLTLRDIHDLVVKIDSKMDDNYDKLREEVNQLKIKLAAHAVIIGLMTVVIAGLIAKVITV